MAAGVSVRGGVDWGDFSSAEDSVWNMGVPMHPFIRVGPLWGGTISLLGRGLEVEVYNSRSKKPLKKPQSLGQEREKGLLQV